LKSSDLSSNHLDKKKKNRTSGSEKQSNKDYSYKGCIFELKYTLDKKVTKIFESDLNHINLFLP
jgi:hypothetical protein